LIKAHSKLTKALLTKALIKLGNVPAFIVNASVCPLSLKNNFFYVKALENRTEALPKDPIGIKLCQIFTYTWNFIQAALDSSGYLARSWTTETRYPIQPRNLWNKFKDPNQLVGLRFDKTTNYMVIDIDRDSIYHPKRSLKKYKGILHALEDIGLVRYIVIRSSHSEGIHIYYFLSEKVSTFKLAVAVQNALEDNGYYVKKGQLEIFPNVKAYNKKGVTNYNGIRLPLQPNTGSYILDDDCEPMSDSIEEFLDMAESTAQQQDLETLKEAIAAAKKRHKPKFVTNGSSENKAAEWERDLLVRIEEGWTAHGQTNDLLKDIACHGVVFKGFSGDPLTRYIYETAIHSAGYRRWCRHQHEIHKRCSEWARCAEKYWKPLYSSPDRVETYREMWEKVSANKNNNINEERHREALERMKQAVERVVRTLGELPRLVEQRIKAICKAAKELTGKTFGRKTLYKNEFKKLWHPEYRNSDNSEVREPKPSNDKHSEELLHNTSEEPQNEGSEKAPECPVQEEQKEFTIPAPIYEGYGAALQPLEAPQERREGAVNSMEGGLRGDEGSRAASEKSENKPQSSEFEGNVPSSSEDRLNGQETAAESKNSPETTGEQPIAAAHSDSRPDPNNQESSLPYSNFFQVLRLRIQLTVKARKMAELEAAERGIESKDSIEAIKRRILNELFRESGEPVLIAEVEQWEDRNF